MNLRDQIDQLKYVLLTEIGEPEPNTLRVVIREGRLSDETETIEVGGQK